MCWKSEPRFTTTWFEPLTLTVISDVSMLSPEGTDRLVIVPVVVTLLGAP